MLIENKVDFFYNEEVKEDQELKNFAETNNFCGCYKVSAKTGLNITESMEFLIINIINRKKDMKQEESEENSEDEKNIILDPGDIDDLKKKDKSCCF